VQGGTDIDLATATATELAAALADGALSSRELLDALVARVEERNPTLNAVVALDVDRARVAAEVADDELAAGRRSDGRPLGPFHGLPMTIKDAWETEGVVTTCGAPELAQHVPATDAVAVSRLKEAGAIVFGKTNTPLYTGDLQTYNDVYGVTSNPWNPRRTAGGSSGGSAAAVAAGLTPLELGSDIGGSIRNPSHYNGVYGLKPSWGVVPDRGHIPEPPGSLVERDVNVGGPLARSVADLRAALDVIAGPLPADAVAWRLELPTGPAIDGVRALRVATVLDQGRELLPVASEVRDVLRAFADRLAAAGASVEEVPLPVPLADGFRSWQDLVLPIIGSELPDDTYAAFTGLDGLDADDVMLHAGQALVLRYRDWARANGRRQHERARWAELFERYDAVLAPVMPTAAYPHDVERPMVERVVDVDGTPVPHSVSLAWCGAIGSVLVPVVALPAGHTPAGLPVGVQLIGPYLSDARLLDIAGAVDRAAGPGFVAPPWPPASASA
jgi:amidase